MMMKVCRRTTFNSAHRLLNKNWSDEKNQEVFGKCNSPNYHGHNYTLETWLEGEVDPDTGYVIDLGVLKEIIKEEVEDPFDHRNLNLDVPDFYDLNPTAENIALVIFRKLKLRLPNYKMIIRLYETQNNFVEYTEDY
ncbi:MAG: 6-carboxytetrahydropterin synthase [Crocinitomicaceae bacterium]|nr:6-carboxytetrahydropterin synthase [Crocinitomicaceae bacterium]